MNSNSKKKMAAMHPQGGGGGEISKSKKNWLLCTLEEEVKEERGWELSIRLNEQLGQIKTRLLYTLK